MNCFVWFGAAVALLTANTWATATTKPESRISVAVKPKREAHLSGASSSYHGPSYKYLPPAPASIGVSASGYDSYSSHGGNSASFGASGSAGIGYDIGGTAVHASAPKVETYIVQTEPAHGGYAGGVSSHGGAVYSGGSSSQFGAGRSHVGHSSAGSSGYRYSSGAPHFQSGASTLLGHSSFGAGGGSSYKFHTKARPHIQTFIIPASSLRHGAGGSSGAIHSSGSFGSGHTVHASGSSSAAFGSSGYQHAPTFGSSLHKGAGGFSSTHGSGFGGGHSGAAAFGGHSSSGFGVHGSNSVTYTPQQGYSYSGHGGRGSAASGLNSRAHGAQDGHLGSGATLSFASHGDYSGQEFSQSAPSIPSTSYGVPAGPVVTSYLGAADTGNSHHSSGYDTPSYAVGHKGLRHFSFSASKPQALNTDFIASGNSDHSEHSGGTLFKPSALLGTTHEVSGPAAQYLPPTSPGYEYLSPSVLQGGTSTTINEPDSAYLPPVATPGASYLPPHHH